MGDGEVEVDVDGGGVEVDVDIEVDVDVGEVEVGVGGLGCSVATGSAGRQLAFLAQHSKSAGAWPGYGQQQAGGRERPAEHLATQACLPVLPLTCPRCTLYCCVRRRVHILPPLHALCVWPLSNRTVASRSRTAPPWTSRLI